MKYKIGERVYFSYRFITGSETEGFGTICTGRGRADYYSLEKVQFCGNFGRTNHFSVHQNSIIRGAYEI